MTPTQFIESRRVEGGLMDYFKTVHSPMHADGLIVWRFAIAFLWLPKTLRTSQGDLKKRWLCWAHWKEFTSPALTNKWFATEWIN